MKDAQKINIQFKVVISGEGIDVTRMIDADKLAILLPIVLGSKATSEFSRKATGGGGVRTQMSEVKESIRQFLDEVGATTNVDLIVAIAYYLWQNQDKQEFSKDEMRAQFLSAHEKMPGNLHRDFRVACDKGMIASVHDQADSYYITKTGIKAVEQLKTSNMN